MNSIKYIQIGSNKLNEMKNTIHEFNKFISGIIKSKNMDHGTIICDEVLFYRNFKLEIKIDWTRERVPRSFVSDTNRTYSLEDDFPKKMIPYLFKKLPEILTLICHKYPEIKKDVDFFISMADG
jgi:hypothetical protein